MNRLRSEFASLSLCPPAAVEFYVPKDKELIRINPGNDRFYPVPFPLPHIHTVQLFAFSPPSAKVSTGYVQFSPAKRSLVSFLLCVRFQDFICSASVIVVPLLQLCLDRHEALPTDEAVAAVSYPLSFFFVKIWR